VTAKDGGSVGYQVAFRYHLAEAEAAGKPTLTIDLEYNRLRAQVGESLTATARVRNVMDQPARMVMVELPAPPGFGVDVEALSKQVAQGTVDKVELQGRRVVVYLRGLDAGEEQTLKYRLEAKLPASVTAAPARVYEYYAPERQGFSAATRLTAEARR
jgi:uncharacterized protein YfaS (alpha-2-macroglobulin family)